MIGQKDRVQIKDTSTSASVNSAWWSRLSYYAHCVKVCISTFID